MPGKVGAGSPGAVPRCAAVRSPCPAGPLRDGGPKRGQQPDGGKGQARVALVQSREAGGLSWARATPGRSDNLGLRRKEAPQTRELRSQLLEGLEGVNISRSLWRPE